jgi:alkylhydroperoxidase family enzyme
VFGTGQRACLAFCEQSLVDVSQITDEQTDAITAELGVQALADFVSALLVIEQRQRLCLTWTQLFGEQMPMPGETTTRRAAVTSRRTLDHERRIPVGVRADASLDRALATWQASVVVLDAVDPVTTELVRLRAAAHHDCRTCKSLRMVAGRDAGVDETMTAKIDRFENSDLPERHKVALRFADVMMTQPAHMSNELKLHLHQHFSDAELLELSLDVMKWNYQKVPVALRTDTEPAPGRLTMLAFDEQGRHHFM